MTVQFETVAVLGAGTMGAGIAQVCAQAGSRVILRDISDEFVDRGWATITGFLDKGVAKGKVAEADAQAAKDRIERTTDLAAAVRGAQLVIEAVPEKIELKRQVFAEVSAACSTDTVLGSNTSSLAIADVFEGIANPERCCGLHFFNPVPIMALLEIVRPAAASDQTIDAVRTYAGQIGKEPILVRDSPGFATSRLGVVLGLEAIRMVEAEVASPEDIDKAMELGYRHPMGPLRLTDLVGLDVRMNIADYLRSKLDSPAFEVPPLMREMVAAGKLGKKSGQGFYGW